MDAVECLVIGAGVVGPAVARALARAGREAVVVEAEDAIGTGGELAQQRSHPR